MHPFGYGATLPQPNDLAIMKNLSSIAVASIKSVNGNNYSIGSPYSLLCKYLSLKHNTVFHRK